MATKFKFNVLTGRFDLVNRSSSIDQFTFYRLCNVYDETWLRVDNTISNLNGLSIKRTGAKITEICVKNDITTDFDLEIYEHDGNSVNLTLLDVISINSSNQSFTLSEDLTISKQIAIKLVNLSGDRPKNLKVEMVIEG